jgi:hypothetical protein
VKAARGTAPRTGPNADPADPSTFTVISKLLLRIGFAGQVGPWNAKNPRKPSYGLLVPHGYALAEAQLIFNRKGWGLLSEHEFNAALITDGIEAYQKADAKTAERQRLASRLRSA